MFLYTNEKAQKTVFLPIDVQKHRIKEWKFMLFANYYKKTIIVSVRLFSNFVLLI